MQRSNTAISLLIIILSCFFWGANAQVRPDAETEYLRIRTMAFDGSYSEATAELRKLLKIYPSYGDARILLGRVLAWQKEYEQALAEIDTVLLSDPGNGDALGARNDIINWSSKKSRAGTDIRTGYFVDSFSKPYNRFWQVFKAGAGHLFNWGQASAGINYGTIRTGETAGGNNEDLQFEAEAWPKLTAENYAYFAYAYSPGNWFPRHRGALEIWQVMPKGWSVSAGINYFHFERDDFIASMSLEKYLGKYWFSAKGYLFFKVNGPTGSFYFNSRRYLNDSDYIQLTLGTGTAPDEPFDVQTDMMRLSANSIRLAYYGSVAPKLVIRIGAGYSREEYAENAWRDRFEGTISFIHAIGMK
jgi:YaiO family outer membrane protein